ncbi:MAG: hypothetical protein JWM85_385 [Acidimicrobiaceae bacterium]|nr:hypothetical protein [Acidimicrobiaceae bacterium]
MPPKTSEKSERGALLFCLVYGIACGYVLGRAAEEKHQRELSRQADRDRRLLALERRALLEEHPEFAMPGEHVPAKSITKEPTK